MGVIEMAVDQLVSALEKFKESANEWAPADEGEQVFSKPHEPTRPECVPDGAPWDWAVDGLGRCVPIWVDGEDVRIRDPYDQPFIYPRHFAANGGGIPGLRNGEAITPALAETCRQFLARVEAGTHVSPDERREAEETKTSAELERAHRVTELVEKLVKAEQERDRLRVENAQLKTALQDTCKGKSAAYWAGRCEELEEKCTVLQGRNPTSHREVFVLTDDGKGVEIDPETGMPQTVNVPTPAADPWEVIECELDEDGDLILKWGDEEYWMVNEGCYVGRKPGERPHGLERLTPEMLNAKVAELKAGAE